MFNEILKHTCRPSFEEAPNLGNTKSAIQKCKEEMDRENIGICFSASNGIELMAIYARKDSINKIIKIAKINCNKDLEFNWYREIDIEEIE
jgi:hypothetical protein